MTDVTLVFSLTLKNRHPQVYVIVNGRDPQIMEVARVDAEHRVIYETRVVYKNVTRFPMGAGYNYAVDGTLMLATDQQFVVARPPLSYEVIISDSAHATDKDKFRVNFRINVKAKHNQSVKILWDSEVGEDPDRAGVKMSKVDGCWCASALFSCFVLPLSYKYVVVNDKDGQVVKREEGKAHVLFVHSPVGGTCVSVYDCWSEISLSFPYYGKPLQPCKFRPMMPLFLLEFLPSQSDSSAFFVRGPEEVFGAMSSDNPEPLCRDRVWLTGREISKAHTEFFFQLGYLEKNKVKWLKDKHNVCRESSYSPSEIRFRLLEGNLSDRMLCVYAPLVSLTKDWRQQVGDFETLVEFARWVKRCRIAQIDVLIEKLYNGLLDPIHAVVPYECSDVHIDMETIRKAKIASLWIQYQEWKSLQGLDHAFVIFNATWPWITNMCDSEFAVWVQYILHQQLLEAFEKILEIGVQMITEFSPLQSSCDIDCMLTKISHYCHGIRLVGVSTMLTITKRTVELFVGPDHVSYVLSTFCDVENDTVKLKAAYCDPRNLETTLTYMDRELRASLERPLRRFVEMATAHDPGKVMDSLSRAASLASSAIIMDPESTRHFGPKKVMEGFGMIPSYDAFSGHHRCVLVPSQLSPEMISQFPSDAGLDEILSMVTNECQMEEVSVTVYLFDLLTCFGNYERKQPEAIQSIPGHHRFRMPFCIQDLLEDSATNQRIQKFLDECQRSC